jgi:hypothetical protein
MPVILAIWEAKIVRFEIQDQPGQIVRPYLQTNRAKWTGGMAQAVQT